MGGLSHRPALVKSQKTPEDGGRLPQNRAVSADLVSGKQYHSSH